MGTTYTIDPTDGNNAFTNAINGLAAGDTLNINSGVYQNSSRPVASGGSVSQPITVQKTPGQPTRPIICQSNPGSYETLQFNGANYWTVSGIQITGDQNGEGDPDGYPVMFRNSTSDHVTLSDVYFSNGGVGVEMDTHNTNTTFRSCKFWGFGGNDATGEDMYLGNNSSTVKISNLLVELCWFGPKHATWVSNQGDSIELKPGCCGCTIRDNVIYNNAGYVGIWSYGNGSYSGESPNVIERNFVYGVSGGNGIYVNADTTVKNNLVMNCSDVGIWLYQNDDKVSTYKNVLVYHNTVYNTDAAAFRADLRNGYTNYVIANNAFYRSANATVATINGAGYGTFKNNYLGPGPTYGPTIDNDAWFAGDTPANAFITPGSNFYPKSGSRLIGVANATYAVSDDFNPSTRASTYDVGCYETDGRTSNPGWAIQEGFKTLLSGGPLGTPVLSVR